MSARHGDSTGAPASRLEQAGARVRQRALSGTEASTIGFVLVAYIGAGAGIGYLLDSLFKTSWIVALGVLGGAAIGFREMFRMAQKLTRQSIDADRENGREKLSQTAMKTEPVEETMPVEEEEPKPPRAFSIPPPPAASFEKPRADAQSRDES
jgi:F0F1-type ATP synthase assembly protein I